MHAHCSQVSVMVIDQQDSNHNGCQRPFLPASHRICELEIRKFSHKKEKKIQEFKTS
jgi:hypothetical protein